MVNGRVAHRRPGRICKYPGCGQTLSIYNLGEHYCFVHQRKTAFLTQGERNSLLSFEKGFNRRWIKALEGKRNE
jgi:hypothetical protein